MDYNNTSSITEQNSKCEMLLDVANAQWMEIDQWLTTKFHGNKADLTLSENRIHKLLQIVHRIISTFTWDNCLEAPVAQTLTETLKAFRLYVINEKVAEYLIEEPLFYSNFHALTMCLFTKRNGPEVYTKYLLHFLLNLLSVGNEEQRKPKRHKIGRHFIQNIHCFFINGYGHISEASALIYYICYDMEIEDKALIEGILQYHQDKDKTNEFLDFLVEKIVFQRFLWKNYWQILPSARLELLRCLRDMFIYVNYRTLAIKALQLPDVGLQCLVNTFIQCSSIIFQVTTQVYNPAVEEVSCTLEVLAHLSSKGKYLTFLQNNKDILINAGVLLINVHRLGKTPDNVFSAIQKLSELQNPSQDVRGNPVFGFKADLVRLIGNLCWKSTRMQDLARESELIPVLLDCCNIDAKNPFIMQWVILAIRNICENNKDNQAVIGSLTQQGVVSSEVLKEFGLTLHSEEDLSIGIVQLDINKQVLNV